MLQVIGDVLDAVVLAVDSSLPSSSIDGGRWNAHNSSILMNRLWRCARAR